MPQNILQRSINLLLKRQTSILSAAFIIMLTVVMTQILGLLRERLLRAIFGASDILGIYQFAHNLPDMIFQLTIAAALSSAFIPVFSEYLTKNKEKEGHQMAATLLAMGLVIFGLLSLILLIFAPFFLQIFNLGGQFTPQQMALMANLMRIILLGQIMFIIGSFFSALLQSYNHFFIPGFASALYNLGIIAGLLLFSSRYGIYAAPIGVIIGAFIFMLVQLPLARRVGFTFSPSWQYLHSHGLWKVFHLMWPRMISMLVFQLGTVALGALITYLAMPGRMYVIFNSAQTLAFAPVVLFGQTIAQAAFPILSREKDNPEHFKGTFITSFMQMLYLILPVSALILVLRIPIVRLAFGASAFDWDATVLTGRTLAYLSLSVFASALITLVYRAFYALHNTFIPLFVGVLSTLFMLLFASGSILIYNNMVKEFTFPYSFFDGVFKGELVLGFDVQGVALAYSIATILNLAILMIFLTKKIGGFSKEVFLYPLIKIFVASGLTAIALYIPLKLLDQLVFDTSRTVGLIILTGISSFIGLSLYLFLTWLFDVREAKTYLLIFKRVGNWREILGYSDEVIDANRVGP